MIDQAPRPRPLSIISSGTDSEKKRLRVPETVVVVGLGVIIGALSMLLGGLENRWIVYFLGAVFILPALALTRHRERLLMTLFLLSMQFDVYIRFLYGRAGTSGLAISLSILLGAAFWAQLRYGSDTRSDDYVWLGALRKPILATLGTTCIALVFSVERFASVSRLMFELQLLLVYSLALNMVRRERGISRSLHLLAIVLGVQATICIVQSRLGMNFSLLGEVRELGAVPRPGGTVSTNPAGFASFIMPIIMVLTARFVSHSERDRRKSDGIVVLLGITAIVLTFTRAAWVGLFLGLAYVTVVGFRRRYITLRKVVAMGALAAVIFMFAIPLMRARLQEASLSDSYDERARLNGIAISIIREHPLFGLGPGAYDFRFKDFIGSNWRDEDWVAGVHNEYLMRTAETGIPGGVAFVWLLIAALAQARRLAKSPDESTRLFGLGWSAGLLALAWQMYWVPWRRFSYNSMLWLFLGLSEGLGEPAASRRRRPHARERDDEAMILAPGVLTAGIPAKIIGRS